MTDEEKDRLRVWEGVREVCSSMCGYTGKEGGRLKGIYQLWCWCVCLCVYTWMFVCMPETCTCMPSLCSQSRHCIMGNLLTCLWGYSRNSLTVLRTQKSLAVLTKAPTCIHAACFSESFFDSSCFQVFYKFSVRACVVSAAEGYTLCSKEFTEFFLMLLVSTSHYTKLWKGFNTIAFYLTMHLSGHTHTHTNTCTHTLG